MPASPSDGTPHAARPTRCAIAASSASRPISRGGRSTVTGTACRGAAAGTDGAACSIWLRSCARLPARLGAELRAQAAARSARTPPAPRRRRRAGSAACITRRCASSDNGSSSTSALACSSARRQVAAAPRACPRPGPSARRRARGGDARAARPATPPGRRPRPASIASSSSCVSSRSCATPSASCACGWPVTSSTPAVRLQPQQPLPQVAARALVVDVGPEQRRKPRARRRPFDRQVREQQRVLGLEVAGPRPGPRSGLRGSTKAARRASGRIVGRASSRSGGGRPGSGGPRRSGPARETPR